MTNEQTGLRIWHHFLAGNLYSGQDTSGIDIEESTDKYVALLDAAIHEIYPEAVIEISHEDAEGGAGARTTVEGDDEEGLEAFTTEENVRFDVEGITERIFSKGEWYIMSKTVNA